MLVNQNIAQNAYLYTVILFVSTPIASIDRITSVCNSVVSFWIEGYHLQ